MSPRPVSGADSRQRGIYIAYNHEPQPRTVEGVVPAMSQDPLSSWQLSDMHLNWICLDLRWGWNCFLTGPVLEPWTCGRGSFKLRAEIQGTRSQIARREGRLANPVSSETPGRVGCGDDLISMGHCLCAGGGPARRKKAGKWAEAVGGNLSQLSQVCEPLSYRRPRRRARTPWTPAYCLTPARSFIPPRCPPPPLVRRRRGSPGKNRRP